MNLAMLNQILEEMKDPVAVLDLHGCLLEMNEAFVSENRRILDTTIAPGTCLHDLYCNLPDWQELLQLHFKAALAGKKRSWNAQVMHDGKLVQHYKISCKPLQDTPNTPVYILFTLRPQGKVVHCSSGKEAMLFTQKAIDHSALVITLDPAGNIVLANTFASQLLQRPAEKLQGSPFGALVTDKRKWQDIWKKLQTGISVRTEICCHTSTAPIWLDMMLQPAPGAQTYLLFGMDITGRKLLEIKRKKNDHYFGEILENLPIGLQQFTAEGISIDMNSKQRDIWGEDHALFTTPGYNLLTDPFYQHNGLSQLFAEVAHKQTPVTKEILLKYTEQEYGNVTRIHPVYFEAIVFSVSEGPGAEADLFLILTEITEKKLAEISLRKSERLLDNIIENLPVGYIQFDSFGFVQRINHTQRHFLNTPESLSGVPFNVMNDRFARMFQLDMLFTQALQQNETLRLEKKVDFSQDEQWTQLGREVCLDLTVFPVEDPVDKDMIVVALVNDITEKKLQEAENLQNQEFLLQTGKVGKIGGWEVDMTTCQVRWSAETYHIFEMELGTPLDNTAALEFYTEDSRKEIDRLIKLCKEEGKPYDAHFNIITAKGNHKRINSIGQPGYKDGKLVRLYGVCQDITEQHQIRDELSRNTELMRLFFDAIDMGYAAIERDGTLNFANKKAEAMVGHSVTEGSKIFEVFPWLADTVFYNRLQECIDKQESQSFSIYFSQPNKWYDFLLTSMRDGSISVFMWDITESRKMQKDLRKANEQLSTLNKSLLNQNKQLEDFAHITSHNLRAPIANLKALMQMHNEALSLQERELYLGMVQEVIKKIDETLNDLVEVVQIRKDINVEKEKLFFAERLQKVKDVLLVDIETSGIRLTASFDKAPVIEYPRVYLDSILQNFITNAIRYRSADRPLALHLESWEEEAYTVLTVEDNGMGIDMERFGNKLFGFRKTFHKNKDAKGIGLFITKTQVEAMGGSIRAESQPGLGTKFIITFRRE
ncbi:PAS domain S-box protein [Chitinophaga defluvii]|uniref:histidine kinase n=1 Tax=Chitinophaga defluvii TaxID=3163343 RepID=A0ABV2T4L1_9BACT